MEVQSLQMNVESNLNKLEGIDKTFADVDGKKVDLVKVKEIVEVIGYKYDGEVS